MLRYERKRDEERRAPFALLCAGSPSVLWALSAVDWPILADLVNLLSNQLFYRAYNELWFVSRNGNEESTTPLRLNVCSSTSETCLIVGSFFIVILLLIEMYATHYDRVALTFFTQRSRYYYFGSPLRGRIIALEPTINILFICISSSFLYTITLS